MKNVKNINRNGNEIMLDNDYELAYLNAVDTQKIMSLDKSYIEEIFNSVNIDRMFTDEDYRKKVIEIKDTVCKKYNAFNNCRSSMNRFYDNLFKNIFTKMSDESLAEDHCDPVMQGFHSNIIDEYIPSNLNGLAFNRLFGWLSRNDKHDTLEKILRRYYFDKLSPQWWENSDQISFIKKAFNDTFVRNSDRDTLIMFATNLAQDKDDLIYWMQILDLLSLSNDIIYHEIHDIRMESRCLEINSTIMHNQNPIDDLEYFLKNQVFEKHYINLTDFIKEHKEILILAPSLVLKTIETALQEDDQKTVKILLDEYLTLLLVNHITIDSIKSDFAESIQNILIKHELNSEVYKALVWLDLIKCDFTPELVKFYLTPEFIDKIIGKKENITDSIKDELCKLHTHKELTEYTTEHPWMIGRTQEILKYIERQCREGSGATLCRRDVNSEVLNANTIREDAESLMISQLDTLETNNDNEGHIKSFVKDQNIELLNQNLNQFFISQFKKEISIEREKEKKNGDPARDNKIKSVIMKFKAFTEIAQKFAILDLKNNVYDIGAILPQKSICELNADIVDESIPDIINNITDDLKDDIKIIKIQEYITDTQTAIAGEIASAREVASAREEREQIVEKMKKQCSGIKEQNNTHLRKGNSKITLNKNLILKGGRKRANAPSISMNRYWF